MLTLKDKYIFPYNPKKSGSIVLLSVIAIGGLEKISFYAGSYSEILSFIFVIFLVWAAKKFIFRPSEIVLTDDEIRCPPVWFYGKELIINLKNIKEIRTEHKGYNGNFIFIKDESVTMTISLKHLIYEDELVFFDLFSEKLNKVFKSDKSLFDLKLNFQARPKWTWRFILGWLGSFIISIGIAFYFEDFRRRQSFPGDLLLTSVLFGLSASVCYIIFERKWFPNRADIKAMIYMSMFFSFIMGMMAFQGIISFVNQYNDQTIEFPVVTSFKINETQDKSSKELHGNCYEPKPLSTKIVLDNVELCEKYYPQINFRSPASLNLKQGNLKRPWIKSAHSIDPQK